MARKITYCFQGRDWACELNSLTGYWTAQCSQPHSVIVEPDWDTLRESIRNFDPNSPRVDAVAVCDPLPPMGSKAGF